ncbi:30S ribosomal protein S14 [Candidatus Comchoanobacter bicostacola]|uniref:Small ribosomal subunit protein uS14 n=1 Tax=Candidatus Comchoanobacter bicostacola TaxID=2919598 RepID=A0ABY5DI08_9GAMM|nr:30S ribosomal protein S14 [Candidatus Comchoanobacter bicostacola]UTC24285.1 30S ribosomal protein S14 [Candidatus Comchoanobacter bicostacola]
MATKRMIARSKQQEVRFNHKENQEKRQALKEQCSSVDSSMDEKMLAMIALSKRPRDESTSRMVRRCWSCGRPKGVLRRFGLCRCCLFKAFREGYISGLRKASW